MLPGGVNSPVRAFKSVGGQPIIFESVKGSKCYDVDGNEYIDYVGSWGPAIVGHANDEVNDALKAQVDKGTSFGAPCELEVSASSPLRGFAALPIAVLSMEFVSSNGLLINECFGCSQSTAQVDCVCLHNSGLDSFQLCDHFLVDSSYSR